MEDSRGIFITGTNRGLGHFLVKLLAFEHPEIELYVASREESMISKKKWDEELPNNKLHCVQLDILDEESMTRASQQMMEKKIVLRTIVANAAVGCDYGTNIPSVEIAEKTLKTNVVATIKFIKIFLPLLAVDGRVVIVSSKMGQLNVMSEWVRSVLEDVNITEETIYGMIEQYIEGCKKGDLGQFNWSAYRTSKGMINSWGRKMLKESQTMICLHPGHCQTDMGGKHAPITVEEGARRINVGIWLNEVDSSQFYNTKPCSWVSCE